MTGYFGGARKGVVLAAVASVLPFVAVLFSGVALADSCAYDLSPPQLATVSGGVQQIAASLTPRKCEGLAQPTITTVCLSSANSSGRCATANAWNAATVFVDPTDLAGYVSYGKGCLNHGKPPTGTCVDYGPAYGVG